MNFDSMTTDELASHLPPAENNRWEFKSADFLKKPMHGLDEMLGKQVSAFANTSGGHLVLGMDDKSRVFRPCEQFVSRQPMKDFLATKVSSSVERPLSNFGVHRIPFTNDPTQAVYLISLPDSPAAPHQSRYDKHYYWRLDGKTDVAPHFHLENLRDRFTKSVLEIEMVEHSLSLGRCGRRDRTMAGTESVTELHLSLEISVKNVSLYSAQTWGVHVKSIGTSDFWEGPSGSNPLCVGMCVRGKLENLLPDERAVVTVQVFNTITTPYGDTEDHKYHVMNELTGFAMLLRPVSQNHVGGEFHFGNGRSYEEDTMLAEHFMVQMRNAGCDLWKA